MGEHATTPAESAHDKSDERDELRTIAFRMREIQRLLRARVVQENRRLEAEGLEPVTDSEFSLATEEPGAHVRE
ncbi:MAG: hypothetical protein ABEJ28_10255 [Salinigranum sp.]